MNEHLLKLLNLIKSQQEPPVLMINPEWYKVIGRAFVETSALSNPFHQFNYALRCYAVERGTFLAQTSAIPPNYVMICSRNDSDFVLLKLWDEPIPQMGTIFNNVKFKTKVPTSG